MIVPNYVPDPVEVPGNVTEMPYRDRLAFIRRVSILHLASVAWIAGVVVAPNPPVPLRTSGEVFFACLLMLSLIRIALRGQRVEALVSAAFLPILLSLAGLFAEGLIAANIPIWAGAISISCAVIYSLLCGRDFSFVGQFFLAGIASTVIIAAGATQIGLDHAHAAIALGINAAVLLFYCYDLASLLSRRRIGEEFAGVVDLYRDVLNVFGWTIRVVQHWFRHGIFTVPLIEPRKPRS